MRLCRLPAKESHGSASQESPTPLPDGGFISVWHFGLTQSKKRALNNPAGCGCRAVEGAKKIDSNDDLHYFMVTPKEDLLASLIVTAKGQVTLRAVQRSIHDAHGEDCTDAAEGDAMPTI